jgi:hypothetical protein
VAPRVAAWHDRQPHPNRTRPRRGVERSRPGGCADYPNNPPACDRQTGCRPVAEITPDEPQNPPTTAPIGQSRSLAWVVGGRARQQSCSSWLWPPSSPIFVTVPVAYIGPSSSTCCSTSSSANQLADGGTRRASRVTSARSRPGGSALARRMAVLSVYPRPRRAQARIDGGDFDDDSLRVPAHRN